MKMAVPSNKVPVAPQLVRKVHGTASGLKIVKGLEPGRTG
jgi:hypothetical protein